MTLANLLTTPAHVGGPAADRPFVHVDCAGLRGGAAAARYGRPAPRLAAAAEAALLRYSWPGNVRELRHVVERAALLCEDGAIRGFDLPAMEAPPTAADSAAPPAAVDSAAARRLGVSRMAMRYRMKKHGL